MRIVFAGTPESAVPTLRALVAAGHSVVGVITRPDAPIGRKRVLTPSPVAEAATALGIPILRTAVLDSEATEWVRQRDVELGVIVAYGGLVREPLLSLPVHGWVNLHFSTLPKWRGAAPVQRALQAGEHELGVSVFRLVAALDAGDVLTRDTVSFAPGTSAGAALAQLAVAGTDTVLRAVEGVATGTMAGEPQQGTPSYAAKLTREDGKLDLRGDTETVLAHWAGVTPEPGAYALCDDVPLKLVQLSPAAHPLIETDPQHAAAAPHSAAVGSVTLCAGRAVLQLCDGILYLDRVQPAGKPAMDGAAWLRGRKETVVLR